MRDADAAIREQQHFETRKGGSLMNQSIPAQDAGCTFRSSSPWIRWRRAAAAGAGRAALGLGVFALSALALPRAAAQSGPAQTPPAAPAAAQPTPAAGEKPIAADSLNGGGSALLTFGEDPNRQLVINGFAVLNYDYNGNTHGNSFADSALALSFYKGITDNITVFAQLTTSRDDPSPFLADAGAGRDISTDIDNLQLRWQPSLQSGFDVTIGKFDSPMAIERDDAPLNFQATNSFTFDYARPVKFVGVVAHDAVSPEFEIFGLVANGWDQDVDNNSGKTGGLYGLWSPSLAAHLGLGVLYGPEKDNLDTDDRTAVVATLLLQPAANWVIGGESVYGSEPHAAVTGGLARWYGEMLFTHYRFDRHWAATARVDYFDDVGGSRTGTPQVLRSWTLSPQYLIGGGFFGIFRYLDRTSLRLPEVTLRLDLRYDQSTAPVFAAAPAALGRRDHTQATLQTVFLF
jgi:hypothetical protein